MIRLFDLRLKSTCVIHTISSILKSAACLSHLWQYSYLLTFSKWYLNKCWQFTLQRLLTAVFHQLKHAADTVMHPSPHCVLPLPTDWFIKNAHPGDMIFHPVKLAVFVPRFFEESEGTLHASFRVCSRYLVSITPRTILGRSYWNFTGVSIMVWFLHLHVLFTEP